ncbi:MAG: UDPGP type 1 family protein, partial [Planctomycetes bacterium]|nr:UDPGP type 1 family protein [Planctomycetota bacterium]
EAIRATIFADGGERQPLVAGPPADVPAADHPAARAERAGAPSEVIRLPRTDSEGARWTEAARHGEELLRAGRVAAILVAGGQGTRLGFSHPKGVLAIGPVSGCSLYQLLAEQLLARSRRAGATIPYYVMTSDSTHGETVAFFEAHRYFGLDRSAVKFFRQGNMPAVAATTGQLLMADKSSLCLAPDGHGGLLSALCREGLVDDMRDRGVEHLYYHQVDNPTAIVCDPAFLGWHVAAGSEMTTKVVGKRSWDERMGVVVSVDGRTQIIEYSDLPEGVAQKTTDDGELYHWAGSMAIHAFDRQFLERLIADDLSLPFHVARKAVSCIDDDGKPVEPAEPNACKFERFIFDALPHARRALVVEADRAREFNPVKNAEGDDSPATARAALVRLASEWLRAAGVDIPAGATVEIGPLFALDADEAAERIRGGRLVERRVCLG